MESPDSLDTQDKQDTPITDKMSNSLDNYYCDDYDDTNDIDDNDNEYDHINTQDLITCGNCGNIWDGYAQCKCYQINFYDSESDSDSSNEQEQEQYLENPARKFSENDETESVNNEDIFENINSEDINHEN